MRLMILIFVLAAFVLAAMRSMAQQDSCLLPPAERPDYCAGNTSAITAISPAPQATVTPGISSYPGPEYSYPPAKGGESMPAERSAARHGLKLNSFLKTALDFCNEDLTWLIHKYNFYCEVIHGLYP